MYYTITDYVQYEVMLRIDAMLSGMKDAMSLNWVWGLVFFYAFVGFCSLCPVFWGLKKEIKAFEKRRKTEFRVEIIKQLKEYSTAKKRADFFKFKLCPNKQPSAFLSDPRWHHRDRLKTIIESTFPNDHDEGKLPTLDDLRELTYRAEMGRRSVWFLNFITATFLIVGILGTLNGVHQALPEDDSSRMVLADVALALLPSAVSVFFTITLIIFRSVYRRAFSLHLARLDRHTLRYYFPLFRHDELNENSFKVLESQMYLLISAFGSFIAIIDKIHRYSKTKYQTFDTFYKPLWVVVDFNQKISERLNEIKKNCSCLQVGSNKLGDVKFLLNSIDACLVSVKKNTQSLLDSSTQINSLVFTSDNMPIQNLLDELSKLPQERMTWEYKVSCLKQLQDQVFTNLDGGLKKLAEDCSQTNTILIPTIEQAHVSAQAIGEVKQKIDEHRQCLDDSKNKYEDYHKKLESCYQDVVDKFKPLHAHFDDLIKYINNICEKIETQIQRCQDDFKMWKILCVVVLILFIVNVYVTINWHEF